MLKLKHKLALLGGMTLLATFLVAPKVAQAQWPPFDFNLNPSFEDGKITYQIEFSKQIDWPMADVSLKIPLPAGTRFLEAHAPATTSVDFDGKEITLFTSVVHRPIKDTVIVLEATDPNQTIFTTHAWIAWKGEMPGDYLTDDIVLDLARQPLNWDRPRSRLRLEATATVTGDVITYKLYPRKATQRRMWDLKINVPIPQGATFISTQAPLPFVADFDGREVSFSISEMDMEKEREPLTFQVSTKDVTDPLVTTFAWATWKNVGRTVGRRVPFTETLSSGNIVVNPYTNQHVMSDLIGDTPFANYDLTSIALQEDASFQEGASESVSNLEVSFYTFGPMGPVGDPLEYIMYIDSDCTIETGGKRGNRGAEYWVRYKHNNGKAYLYTWNDAEQNWDNRQQLESSSATDNMITVSIPNHLLETDQQFCWLGRGRNQTKTFAPNPPNEWVGTNPDLTRYTMSTNSPQSFANASTDTPISAQP